MIGRVDVHAHLIPRVDDGCLSMEESLDCARLLVRAGYSHAFCTPHVWPDLPHNNVANISRWVAEYQQQLDGANIPLRVLAGGELNLQSMWPVLPSLSVDQIPTYAMAGTHVLVDLWADRLPDLLEPAVKHLQSLGLTVILAHPERMKAIQANPALADRILNLGVLLQGNLQCFSDPAGSPTRTVAERFLAEDRYFMLGSDTHRLNSLPTRLDGLLRILELAPAEVARKLTIDHPRSLIPDVGFAGVGQ